MTGKGDRLIDVEIPPDARLVILEPIGPQGPKIGLALRNEKDELRAVEVLSGLSETDRQSAGAVRNALEEANLLLVKP